MWIKIYDFETRTQVLHSDTDPRCQTRQLFGVHQGIVIYGFLLNTFIHMQQNLISVNDLNNIGDRVGIGQWFMVYWFRCIGKK